MNLGHRRNVGLAAHPCTQSGNRNGSDRPVETIETLRHHVFSAQRRGIAVGWRVSRKVQTSRSTDEVGVQKTLDPVESLEDKFVASIELDARLSVDAVRIELGTEPTSRLGPITPRLSTSTNLTLVNQSAFGRQENGQHKTLGNRTYRNGRSSPRVIHCIRTPTLPWVPFHLIVVAQIHGVFGVG